MVDLTALHKNAPVQALLGLLIGIVFGFLLQKGAVTTYDVILGQLLLTDFTVVKVMLSAVFTGMIGFYLLKRKGLVRRHVRTASLGSNMVGGLIFGVGFALLGYCPGTVAGAVGQGSLDALFGGVVGLVLGAGLFSRMYPQLSRGVLHKGRFRSQTLPELLHMNEATVIGLMAICMLVLLAGLEFLGF